MEWVIAVLVSSSAVFFALWRSTARRCHALTQKADTLQTVADEATTATKELAASVSKQEDELKKVDEAHKVLRAELAETARAVSAARLEDGSLATAWDKATGDE